MTGDEQVESVKGGSDLIKLAKAAGAKADQKKIQDEMFAKAKKEKSEFEKKASNSFDGLVHEADGSVKFPDGKPANGANEMT